MPIRLGGLREIIAHADLSDMPDVGGTNTDHDARYYTEAEVNTLIAALASVYLKLDQTTAQDVDNGAPTFNQGLIIKAGQRLIFDGA